MSQIVGVVMLGLAGWLLWSPWALVIAGILLIVGPELAELVQRGRKA
jgi:hypothetical protein